MMMNLNCSEVRSKFEGMIQTTHPTFIFSADQPKFGEIVHEPPTLTLPKRSKANSSKVIWSTSPWTSLIFFSVLGWYEGFVIEREIRKTTVKALIREIFNVELCFVDNERFLFCSEHEKWVYCQESDRYPPLKTESIWKRPRVIEWMWQRSLRRRSGSITCSALRFSYNCSTDDAPSKTQWTFSFLKHQAKMQRMERCRERVREEEDGPMANWARLQSSEVASIDNSRNLFCCFRPSSLRIFSFNHRYP